MHVRVCERLGDPGRGEAGAGTSAEGRGTDVDAGERWAGSARPAEAATARGRRAGRLTPRKRSRRVPGLTSAVWERAIDKATGEDSEDHDFTQIQFLRLFAQISLFEMESGFSPSALPRAQRVPVRSAVLGTAGRPRPALASTHQMLVTMREPVFRRCQHPLTNTG